MKKPTFFKIFLVSFLLILLGQGSNAACSSDGDCVTVVDCIDINPICDETKTCRCPGKPPATNFNNGPKRVHKANQN
ncbi:hypothetical protein P3S68_023178 [Capsicum galapagoense]